MYHAKVIDNHVCKTWQALSMFNNELFPPDFSPIGMTEAIAESLWVFPESVTRSNWWL